MFSSYNNVVFWLSKVLLEMVSIFWQDRSVDVVNMIKCFFIWCLTDACVSHWRKLNRLTKTSHISNEETQNPETLSDLLKIIYKLCCRFLIRTHYFWFQVQGPLLIKLLYLILRLLFSQNLGCTQFKTWAHPLMEHSSTGKTFKNRKAQCYKHACKEKS